MTTSQPQSYKMNARFRGFLPIVVDIETAGVHPQTNAILEIAFSFVELNDQGQFKRGKTHFEHVLPFEGAALDQASLDFNKIDPWQPLRYAVEERIALNRLFKPVNNALKKHQCQRAVLVGHNAWFDLLFLKAAVSRCKVKSPFHAFTSFDTATLAGLFYGQTVLAKAVQAAGLAFHSDKAHSAIYDAEITADLYCEMLNRWHKVMDWI